MRFKVFDKRKNEYILETETRKLFLNTAGQLVVALLEKTELKWHFYQCDDLQEAGIEILYVV